MRIISVLILFSVFAWAEDQKKGPDIAEMKAKAVENIDKRISSLNEMKSCVNAATEPKAIKECRKKHQEQMKELGMEMEEMRHERRMKRMKGDE